MILHKLTLIQCRQTDRLVLRPLKYDYVRLRFKMVQSCGNMGEFIQVNLSFSFFRSLNQHHFNANLFYHQWFSLSHSFFVFNMIELVCSLTSLLFIASKVFFSNYPPSFLYLIFNFIIFFYSYESMFPFDVSYLFFWSYIRSFEKKDLKN